MFPFILSIRLNYSFSIGKRCTRPWKVPKREKASFKNISATAIIFPNSSYTLSPHFCYLCCVSVLLANGNIFPQACKNNTKKENEKQYRHKRKIPCRKIIMVISRGRIKTCVQTQTCLTICTLFTTVCL